MESTPPKTHGQKMEEVRKPPPPEKLQYLTEMLNESGVVKTTGEQVQHYKISPRQLKHFFFNNPMKLFVFACYRRPIKPVATFIFIIEEDI